MPLELGVWRVDSGLVKVATATVFDETKLEDFLEADISIASPNWMVIGRQVRTPYGKFIDLLAIDRDGSLVVIELKRDKTARDVVAQVLDYGSWVNTLDDDDIGSLYAEYLAKYHPERKAQSLDDAFLARFNLKGMPDALNEDHELVVVAAALDESSERIVKYLADKHGVAINVIFFRAFKDGDRHYLTRAWLLDPTEAAAGGAKGPSGDWNGEYYVSFGHNEARNWEDARKYGFISGGGGAWYSKTLEMLEPGNRVWVNVPGEGYVGVGMVTAKFVKVDEFTVKQENGKQVPLTKLETHAPAMLANKDNPETAEYLVAVKWFKTVPIAEAVHERGFFGNQNTVCQPTTKKWDFTVQRLKQHFGVKG